VRINLHGRIRVDHDVGRRDRDLPAVSMRWSGREKLHYLNAVPTRLIHNRWIDKYTERQVSALADLKFGLETKAWQKSTAKKRA